MSKVGLGLMATKVGMTQIFTEEGVRIPVTVLKLENNIVVQKKTVATDGYSALQVGSGTIREKLVNMPLAGHFKKAGITATRRLNEWRVDESVVGGFEPGATLGMDLLNDVKSVDVTGISKGKGTAGVMKRHNMKGFRATHGTHEYFRHGGSIGCRATPGKVHKGKRMSGRMGNETVSIINLGLVKIDAEKGLVFVRGAVPGPPGAVVQIRASSHKAKRGPALRSEAQTASKNPMKASKAGGSTKKK